MSSAASTKGEGEQQRLQPWQFFVLTALACATVLTFLARGAGAVPVVMFTVLMFATALAGLAMLRTLHPLVGPPQELAARRRAHARLARAGRRCWPSVPSRIEFDKAMAGVGRGFPRDDGRLRAPLAVMRQIDAGSGIAR
jgi:hypothetical protein